MTLGMTMTFQVQVISMKEIIDKAHFVKMQNACSVESNVKNIKRQATE